MMRRFHFRHRAMLVLLVIACLAPRAAALAANRVATGTASGDLEAARALFETNLDAIRRRDRDAYLACYLHADTLARTGPDGPQWGYDSLAKETGSDWPDLFEGLGLTLIPIRPGLVYGTYRYRVRIGMSVRTPGSPSASSKRWKTAGRSRSEEHTSELQSRLHLVCRLLLEKKKTKTHIDA